MSHLYTIGSKIAHNIVGGNYLIQSVLYTSNHVYVWFQPKITTESVEMVPVITEEVVEDCWVNIIKEGEAGSALVPCVHLEYPTKAEITGRVLTTLAVDVPMYIFNCCYYSPVTTAITLYTILPPELFLLIMQYIGWFVMRLYSNRLLL